MVRRRLFDMPLEERAGARTMLRRLAGARQRLTSVETELATTRSRQASAMHVGKLEARRVAAGSLVAQHQSTLREWASGIGLKRRLEGWIPQGKDASGGYVDLPSCPAPAPPPGWRRWPGSAAGPTSGNCRTSSRRDGSRCGRWSPTRPSRTATPPGPRSSSAWYPPGRPTSTSQGHARFDDASNYEIRCFARRHKPACPRTGPQCHCPIVWSDPTESYQLASHFDLQGTANRPVTVQLPDLTALQSDAAHAAARLDRRASS